MSGNFSWVNIYQQIAKKLKEVDGDLSELLKGCENCQTSYLQDKNNNNQWMNLDLFTLFGSFNRDVKFENRIKILKHLNKKLELDKLPTDFDGIPTMENRNSWFQNTETDVITLNDLFKLALEDSPQDFNTQFNAALEINGVGVSKLTTGLFWINPEKFMPIAGPVKSYLKQKFPDYKYDSKLGIHAWNEVLKNMDWEKYNNVLVFLNSKKKSFKELSLESIESSVENEIMENKNVIFHGAPGTGKTYSVMNAVESLTGGDTDRYMLVQFHPSYGYEDFIDGIKPVKSSSTGINLELENGIFKNICKKAFDNLKSKEDTKSYFFIADEINRAELSRVFGELLLCLEEDKRLRFDKDRKLLGIKIKTQNANLWEPKHAIVIEKKGDKEEFFFGIPENLYFVGTMNDIDRSVDSFDMALRRRFTWIKTEFKDTALRKEFNGHKKLEKYIKVCNELNDYITISKDGYNLGLDYQLGQSYFLKPNDLIQDELDIVWARYIAPLLTEYLRSVVEQHEIPEKLKEAQTKFKL